MNYVNPYAPAETHVPAKSTVDVLLVVIGALMMMIGASVYTGMLLAIPVENRSFVYRMSPWLYGMLHFERSYGFLALATCTTTVLVFTSGLAIAANSATKLVFK
jgi:hypothetical protein